MHVVSRPPIAGFVVLFDPPQNKAETDAAHVVPNSSRLVLDTCKSASVAVVSTIKASGKALSLKQPLSACVDQKTGVIYVADSESYCIRRVNPDSMKTAHTQTVAAVTIQASIQASILTPVCVCGVVF